jgi:hypothetical protein
MNTELSLLDELALLGLAHAGEKGATVSGLKQKFKAELGSMKPDFALPLDALCNRQMAEKLPRGKGQRAQYYRVRPAGREILNQRLGGMAMTGTVWKKNAARLLGLTRLYEIPAAVAATLVKDEALLVWLLAARLGETQRAGTTLKALAARVAAEELGAASTKPQALWNALFQRAGTPRAGDRTEAAASATFAQQVRSAAPRATEGWFGPHKLFIHRAWEAWKVTSGGSDDLPLFKRRLLTALREGELELTRADFTATLDPAELERSEIRDGSETFHFMTSERRQD